MKKTILIVDDEPDFAELIQYRLAHTDYHFHSVLNTTDALNSAWHRPPDLILLDLLLPDLDGLSACEIFTGHPATRHIPIIMISAVASHATRYSAQVAGAREFFSKPVNFDQLKTAIDALLAETAAPTSP